jgi:hypothetical protein
VVKKMLYCLTYLKRKEILSAECPILCGLEDSIVIATTFLKRVEASGIISDWTAFAWWTQLLRA